MVVVGPERDLVSRRCDGTGDERHAQAGGHLDGLKIVGSVIGPERTLIERTPESERRRLGWRVAKAIAAEARQAGFAGIVIMGLRFETAVGEAYEAWHDPALAPFEMATA